MDTQRPLVELFAEEARRRGLLDDTQSRIDAATAFALVREMPYLRATDREPATTIREWRGTCSGKHYLLRALLDELGYETTLVACTAWVPREMAALLPETERAIMDEGPVPDVHNYLRLHSEAGTQLIDATAPLEWGRYGIPVNPEFVWGQDMRPLFEPIDEYEVPDTEDPQAYKARLLARHFSAVEVERRSRFFTAVAG